MSIFFSDQPNIQHLLKYSILSLQFLFHLNISKTRSSSFSNQIFLKNLTGNSNNYSATKFLKLVEIKAIQYRLYGFIVDQILLYLNLAIRCACRSVQIN